MNKGNADNITGANRFNITGLFKLFCKVIAIIFVGLAILQWVTLMGFADPQVRFDTLPNHLKLSVAYLAVIQPVAALGLWSGHSWGIVMWAMAAAAELVMYIFYTSLYGTSETLVFFHLSCLGVMVVYFVVSSIEAVRKEMIEN